MKKITATFLAMLLCAMCCTAYAAGYTVLLEPQFNMAETYESSITKVSKNTKWALADLSGKPITGYNWEALGDITSEYIPAKSGGLWGYISPNGSVYIPYKFAAVGLFKDGMAMVQNTDGSFAYINVSGNVIFTSPFSYAFSASEGAICGMKNGLYGYCDTQGNIIIQPQFDMAFDFHEGYAAVKFGGKWGYITTYGHYSVRPTFDYAGDFKDGYAVCRSGGKYGIIDTSGKRVSSFNFDYIGMPDDSGRYPAKAGAISGFIRSNGEWILQTSYDYCYKYTDGVARVYKDGLWGFINETGIELIPPTFADLGEYYSGRAPYSIDGYLWGYLTLNSLTGPAAPVTPTPTPVPQPPTTPSTPVVPPIEPVNPGTVVIGDDTKPQPARSATEISMRIGSTVALKGSELHVLSVAPALIDETTMIPVRDIVELLGGKVEWKADEQRVILTYNYNKISMIIGLKVCAINGVPGFLSAPPVISNGSTLVPLRAVADALGFKVEWDGGTQNIYISK